MNISRQNPKGTYFIKNKYPKKGFIDFVSKDLKAMYSFESNYFLNNSSIIGYS